MGCRIAQVGSFDVENFGDLLFPDIFKLYMSNDYEVDLFSPNGGIKPFTKDQRVYPIGELEEKCKERKYRAIIIGGGDVIRIDNSVTPDYVQNNNSAAISLWAIPILIGNKYDIPVLLNAPGVPFRFLVKERQFIKDMLAMADYVTVRDETSKELIEECGVGGVMCVPDTLFNANIYGEKTKIWEKFEKVKEKYPIFKMQKYIILQHNRHLTDENAESIKKAVESITKNTDYSVILFPIGYVHDDASGLKKIYDQKNKKCRFFTGKLDPDEMMSVLASSAGYIGTSMHGGIVSWVFGHPIIMLDEGGTATKIAGFQKHIGKDVESLTDYRRLYERFKKVFIDEKMPFEKLPEINKKVNQHFKIMHDMIKSKELKHADMDKVFIEMYNGISNDKRDFHAEIIAYFDTGEGFNIWERKIYAIKNPGELDQVFVVPKGTKRVFFQITDAEALIIENLEIKGNNGTVKYEIPNMAYMKEGERLFFLEPTSVLFKCDESIKKIRILAHFKIPEMKELRALFLGLQQDNRIIKQENANLLQEKKKFDQVRQRKTYKMINKVMKLE